MINKIKEVFAAIMPNTKRAVSINNKNTFYVFQENNTYGVFVTYNGYENIDEKFASIRLYTGNVDGKNVLLLSCNNKLLRDNFACIAADFLLCDENLELVVTNNPYRWFNKWKEAIGNYKKDLMVYDVIGEMKCILELNKIGLKPKWSSLNLGTHDIECVDGAYEVKSTINKTQQVVHISSSIQLTNDNGSDLYLLFCRIEKSELGYSIADLIKELINIGLDERTVNEYLSQKGYSIGKQETYEKYIVREIQKYAVDDAFPKIVPQSFKDGKIPKGIVSIEYSVDLANLNYQKIL